MKASENKHCTQYLLSLYGNTVNASLLVYTSTRSEAEARSNIQNHLELSPPDEYKLNSL